MTWTKLSDDFGDDCWGMSDAAFRLHVEGLLWSNRKLLDLRIPKSEVRRFAKNPDAVTELLEGRWWQDSDDDYVIVHHADYQRSREAVITQQAANQRNGKKGGRPKREQVSDLQRKTQSVSESVSESKTERDRTGQALETQPTTKDARTRKTQPPTKPPAKGETTTRPLAEGDECKWCRGKGFELPDGCPQCKRRPPPLGTGLLLAEPTEETGTEDSRNAWEWQGTGPSPYEEYR